MLLSAGEQVDGGWGWIVVTGSFLNHFLFEGMVRSYGLIYLVLLDRFHGTAAITAWIQATFNAVAMTTGPLTGLIVERYSCRVVVLAGGLLLAVALLIAAYSPNLYCLFFAYSAVGGLAGGFVYSPMVVVISQYFDARRGKAMGLAALGGAVGTASMPPLIGFLLHHYGYAGCMTLLAGISLHHCVAGALYRPLAAARLQAETSVVCGESLIGSTERLERRGPSGLRREEADDDAGSSCSMRILSPTLAADGGAGDLRSGRSLDELTTRSGGAGLEKDGASAVERRPRPEAKLDEEGRPGDARRSRLISRDRLEAMRNVSFLLFCFNLFNIPTTIISTFIFLPGLAEEYGVSGEQSALLVSVIGVSSATGRVLFGFVFDLDPVRKRRRLAHSVLGALLGVSTASVVLCRHFPSMAIVCSCIGLSEGGVMAQRATALSQYVKPKQLTFAFGIMTMFQGFGNLLGPLIQGYLKDALGSYVACFCYGGGMTLLSSCLLIGDYLLRCRAKPTETTSSTVHEDAPSS